jgi:hypothetical protein
MARNGRIDTSSVVKARGAIPFLTVLRNYEIKWSRYTENNVELLKRFQKLSFSTMNIINSVEYVYVIGF